MTILKHALLGTLKIVFLGSLILLSQKVAGHLR